MPTERSKWNNSPLSRISFLALSKSMQDTASVVKPETKPVMIMTPPPPTPAVKVPRFSSKTAKMAISEPPAFTNQESLSVVVPKKMTPKQQQQIS